MEQLDAIWSQLAAFGQDIASIPLAEIQDRLDEFEEAILAVIEADQPRDRAVADDLGVSHGRPLDRARGDDVVRCRRAAPSRPKRRRVPPRRPARPSP